MPKTYLVTGGAGFIGANFVKYLLSTYSEGEINIVILDALTYAGNIATIAEEIKLPNVSFIKGDICDSEVVTKVFDDFDPDYVINFAAESHVDRSILSPREFLKTNVIGTQTLLEAARKNWLNNKNKDKDERRFLQVSTDEVYGSLMRTFDVPQELNVSPELKSVIGERNDVITFGEDLFAENTPIAPRSPYAASKASADMIALAYAETYGLPVIVTRCSNNYGPYQFPEKLIPLIINNLRNDKELPVYGQGLNVRDWLYVEDHVRAIDTVVRNGRVGEVYNIGGLNEQENITIVKTIIDIYAELTDSKSRYDLIRYVTDRPGHDMRYAIDSSKTAIELGWVPKTPFTEGIRLTVAWYLAHTEWMESVTSGAYRCYYELMYKDR